MVMTPEERAVKYEERKLKQREKMREVRAKERIERYKRNSATMENYKQRGFDKDGNLIRQDNKRR